MALCGSEVCGCGLISTPPETGAVNGNLPTLTVNGVGTRDQPYSLTVNPLWAQALANAAGFAVDVSAWIDFTPVVTQGVAITPGVIYSKYQRSGPTGKTVMWNFQLNPSTNGTAGNKLTLSLPVQSAGPAVLTPGSGNIFVSPNRWHLAAELDTTTSTAFVHDISGTAYWGVTPAVGIAGAASVIRGSLVYEGV